MKYINEYRKPSTIKKIAKEIHIAAEQIPHKVNLMEVCGTHTMTIGRFGIRQLLPQNIKLISGPGCPVCVAPDEYIDTAIALSDNTDTIIATFGDMVRVPGSFSSLEKEQAKGKDIRTVYSPLEALDIAKGNPLKKVVFLGVGFETTAPTVALVIKKASVSEIKNFLVLAGHKLITPAMEALLEDREVKIDGFICPGHVSAVIGAVPYKHLTNLFCVPCVIAGFEPVDILEAILLLIKNLSINSNSVEIQYKRAVKEEGNRKAQEAMEEVFDVLDSEWRGLGMIRESGLAIKKKYRDIDAKYGLPVKLRRSKSRSECICGDILKGKKIPPACKLFGKACTPENPIGPCMVSSEGSCAAYYKYGG